MPFKIYYLVEPGQHIYYALTLNTFLDCMVNWIYYCLMALSVKHAHVQIQYLCAYTGLVQGILGSMHHWAPFFSHGLKKNHTNCGPLIQQFHKWHPSMSIFSLPLSLSEMKRGTGKVVSIWHIASGIWKSWVSPECEVKVLIPNTVSLWVF